MSQPDDDDQGQPPPGFMFVTPQMQAAAAARQAAQQAEMGASMQSFFDSLSAEQTFTLLRMMILASNNYKQRLPTYWAGQLHAQLMYVHKKCSCCGLDKHDLDPARFVDAEPVPVAPPPPAFPDAERSPEESLLALNVRVVPVEQLEDVLQFGAVECLSCGTRFPSLVNRAEQGIKCPVCELGPGYGQAH